MKNFETCKFKLNNATPYEKSISSGQDNLIWKTGHGDTKNHMVKQMPFIFN